MVCNLAGSEHHIDCDRQASWIQFRARVSEVTSVARRSLALIRKSGVCVEDGDLLLVAAEKAKPFQMVHIPRRVACSGCDEAQLYLWDLGTGIRMAALHGRFYHVPLDQPIVSSLFAEATFAEVDGALRVVCV